MRKLNLVACALMCSASAALAAPFGISGGSYTANVATYVDIYGNFVNPATATTTGTATSSNPKGVNDSLSTGRWIVGGLANGGGTATATIDMGQIWDINKIYTSYAYFAPLANMQYQLSVSTDGSSYTPVVSTTAVNAVPNNGEKTDTFAATPARYIQWQVSSNGANSNIQPMELMAYVASTASSVPTKKDGYNIARDATILSNNIGTATHGFSPASGSFDGTLSNGTGFYPDGNTPGQTAIIDLGGSYMLNRISTDMYDHWSDGGISISNSPLGPWQVIKPSGSPLLDSSFVFTQTLARYIQLTGNNVTSNGIMTELQVFAVPEPTSVALLGLAGLGSLRRRRQATTA